jgi:hypothetical protein
MDSRKIPFYYFVLLLYCLIHIFSLIKKLNFEGKKSEEYMWKFISLFKMFKIIINSCTNVKKIINSCINVVKIINLSINMESHQNHV